MKKLIAIMLLAFMSSCKADKVVPAAESTGGVAGAAGASVAGFEATAGSVPTAGTKATAGAPGAGTEASAGNMCIENGGNVCK